MGESFRSLADWQRSIALTLAVYRLISSFPDSERFGLTNQLRRASVSVASNIAEGYDRSTKGEYVQFLGNARGSNSEVETQIVISKALGFGTRRMLETAEALCGEVGRMLGALIKSQRLKPPVPSPLVPKSVVPAFLTSAAGSCLLPLRARSAAAGSAGSARTPSAA
jgi:four helix bundle protein